jgi:hypothetical protein
MKLEWNSQRLGRVDGVKKSNRRVNLIKMQDIHKWNTPFNNEYASRNVEQECKTGLWGAEY